MSTANAKPKHRTLEQINLIGSIKFRRGHLIVIGRCVRCGVAAEDLERWPSMLCLPETRPDSARGRGLAEVLFEAQL